MKRRLEAMKDDEKVSRREQDIFSFIINPKIHAMPQPPHDGIKIESLPTYSTERFWLLSELEQSCTFLLDAGCPQPGDVTLAYHFVDCYDVPTGEKDEAKSTSHLAHAVESAVKKVKEASLVEDAIFIDFLFPPHPNPNHPDVDTAMYREQCVGYLHSCAKGLTCEVGSTLPLNEQRFLLGSSHHPAVAPALDKLVDVINSNLGGGREKKIGLTSTNGGKEGGGFVGDFLGKNGGEGVECDAVEGVVQTVVSTDGGYKEWFGGRKEIEGREEKDGCAIL